MHDFLLEPFNVHIMFTAFKKNLIYANHFVVKNV